MPQARALLSLVTVFALLLPAAPAPAAKPNSHATLECTYCHDDTPRFGVDTRATVTYWRDAGDEPALCDRCHGKEDNFHPLGVVPGEKCLNTVCPTLGLPLGTSEAVAGQVVCTTCHYLHAASAEFALLRGFPGSDRPRLFKTPQDLCRQCHGRFLEKRSPHAGDERSCAFCHAAQPRPGQSVILTPAGRRLCVFCHGPKDSKHYAGANPFAEPQECTGCHDPHLGKESPARLKKGYFDSIRDRATLNPHGKRTLCSACHEDVSGGKLRADDPIALCQRCHGSGEIPGMSHPLSPVPAGYAVPQGWPLANGALTCLTCHVPGHLDEDRTLPKLLRGGAADERNAVCFLCHRREQWAGRNPHREVAREGKGCELCHAKRPVFGQDTAETVTFHADINILCLACHDTPRRHPSGIEHTLTLGPRSTPVPADLPLGLGRKITCATCHNPMTDAMENQLLRETEAGQPFCVRCHKK